MGKYILVHGIRVAKDFTPETFGRLTTIGPKFRLSSGKEIRAFQVCQCKCGNIIVACRSNLVRPHTQSCGCLRDERIIETKTKHGMTSSREHATWSRMKARCYRKQSKDYKDYGGRGIKVCDRWLGDSGFENFFEDMGRRPSSDHSLDRIDVNGNYCLENCRWATISEQANNKRNNRNITYKGKTQNITQWGLEVGISETTLRYRLDRGWDIERAFTEPLNNKKK